MDHVVIERKEHVAVLKINRPDALNALNTEVLTELEQAVDRLDADEEVRVIVITGEGRAFVAGADIGEMATLSMTEGRRFGQKGQKLYRKIEKMEKPTIAAVNGFALGGGCELAMACDIRYASETAIFGQPETGLGITPGFSGTQRLTQLVGKGLATEMILSATNIDANRAKEIGLVNRVTPPEELMEETMKLAEKIASNAPLAVRWANSAIKRGMEADTDTGIAIEGDLFGMCFATEDQKEGMKAFLERRKAEFKGL